MTEKLIPIFRVRNGLETAKWYQRLGFVVTGEHRFAPTLPLYLFLDRRGEELHLSEHHGDARPESLAYLWVEDVDEVALEFGVTVVDQPWGREVQLVDPDGNRLRVATRTES